MDPATDACLDFSTHYPLCEKTTIISNCPRVKDDSNQTFHVCDALNIIGFVMMGKFIRKFM